MLHDLVLIGFNIIGQLSSRLEDSEDINVVAKRRSVSGLFQPIIVHHDYVPTCARIALIIELLPLPTPPHIPTILP